MAIVVENGIHAAVPAVAHITVISWCVYCCADPDPVKGPVDDPQLEVHTGSPCFKVLVVGEALEVMNAGILLQFPVGRGFDIVNGWNADRGSQVNFIIKVHAKGEVEFIHRPSCLDRLLLVYSTIRSITVIETGCIVIVDQPVVVRIVSLV